MRIRDITVAGIRDEDDVFRLAALWSYDPSTLDGASVTYAIHEIVGQGPCFCRRVAHGETGHPGFDKRFSS